MNDTIAAISTPPGNGAIGIIRLSGDRARTLLAQLWRGKKTISEWENRRIYMGFLHHPVTDQLLDQVMAFWSQAPHSYTGEDMVEVQAHGGQVLLEAVLQAFLEIGARPAEPGEFTKRAFLNGRMDLLQAEAVADLIGAGNRRAVALAERQLEGHLSQYVQKLRNDVKVMRAQLEAMIDFPEDEDVQGLHYEEINERVGILADRIRKVMETYQEGRWAKEGLRVAIVGKPNAGKSSLFNALLRQDRAIVHATPGTTRDLIEEHLEIDGWNLRFIDTAGLRGGEDSIEAEGIRRTRERLSQADVAIVVLDLSRPWNEEDQMVFETLNEAADKPVLLIGNKKDLPLQLTTPQLPKAWQKKPLLHLSAKEGDGIDILKQLILNSLIRPEQKPSSDLVVTNLRQCDALQKSLQGLAKVGQAAQEKRSLEFLVEDLTHVMDHLGGVTGEITNDEILGEIFSRFCVGK